MLQTLVEIRVAFCSLAITNYVTIASWGCSVLSGGTGASSLVRLSSSANYWTRPLALPPVLNLFVDMVGHVIVIKWSI